MQRLAWGAECVIFKGFAVRKRGGAEEVLHGATAQRPHVRTLTNTVHTNVNVGCWPVAFPERLRRCGDETLRFPLGGDHAKIPGMMDSRCSESGGAVRSLVVVLCVLGLGGLGWLASLPEDLQGRYLPQWLAWMAGGAGLIMLVRLAVGSPKRMPRAASFWLCADGESEPCGPYTVAQIVAMWQAGQITTRGLVTEEGKEAWMPMAAFADQFDSGRSKKPHPLARNGGAVLLLGLILLVFVPPLGGLLAIVGLILWIVGSSMPSG